MMPGADAILRDQEGRSVLRFERTLRHPPERVWRALTDASELASWHPTPFDLDPRARTVSYRPEGDVPDMPAGEITEYDPPRLLAHRWGDDELRWELAPQGDGSLLVLTHTFADRFKAARDAAGWHLCLDALTASLDDRSTALSERFLARSRGGEPPDGTTGEWRELNAAYQERFGIAPEEATPPPEP
jgi:uncharacterized protein YndB with AHSA1/START domain